MLASLRCCKAFLPLRRAVLPLSRIPIHLRHPRSIRNYAVKARVRCFCSAETSQHLVEGNNWAVDGDGGRSIKGEIRKKELWLYNSMSRQNELFKPKVAGKVGMYVCGVTAYDLSHIGHARAYVTFDVLYSLRFIGEHGISSLFEIQCSVAELNYGCLPISLLGAQKD